MIKVYINWDSSTSWGFFIISWLWINGAEIHEFKTILGICGVSVDLGA
mgnify:CR=1 FL=1